MVPQGTAGVCSSRLGYGLGVPLPPQVSPPEFALTEVAPSRVVGVEAVAVAVLAGEDGPALGPGAAELGDDLGVDLLGVLESAAATGETGEVTELPVARDSEGEHTPAGPPGDQLL